MIELHAVSRRYGETFAVREVDLEVARGELVMLVGASGSGKTTTLKMINRLIEPSAGTIRVGGRDVRDQDPPVLRRRIGYVFQQVGLFPHLDVEANVGITPELLDWEPERIRARVEALLERVELDPGQFRGRLPAELSGGQAQRVGLARALAAEPEVLLLDEPFGALDPLTRSRLQQSFREIRQDLGLTAVFVTHDMVEALLLGDRIAVMDEGRLVQVGPPGELLARPADERVSALLEAPRREAEWVRSFLESAG